MERGERSDFPRHQIAIRGWVLELEAYPKSEKARAQSSFPMIGVYPAHSGWESDSAAIVRSKLDGKATHYGDLGAPFVVALHDLTPFASRGVMREALFGSSQPYWYENAQTPNLVSAVLAASDFGMSSPAHKTPELWINPYARYPLPAELLPWPTARESDAPSGGRVIDPAALFNLPKDWPGKPFQRM
jgi:hypothetical protein